MRTRSSAPSFQPARGYEERYEVQRLSNSYIRVRSKATKRVLKRTSPGHVMLMDGAGQRRVVAVSGLLPSEDPLYPGPWPGPGPGTIRGGDDGTATSSAYDSDQERDLSDCDRLLREQEPHEVQELLRDDERRRDPWSVAALLWCVRASLFLVWGCAYLATALVVLMTVLAVGFVVVGGVELAGV